jgi:integrase
MVAVYTAARRSEIARIKRSDINLEDKTIRITIRKGGRNTKGLRIHKIPLHENLIPYLKQHLKELPKAQKCLFTTNDDHLTDTGFDQKKERKKAELLGEELGKSLVNSEFQYTVGWHIHRHSLSSLLAKLHFSVEDAMKFVGHKTESIHNRYRHTEFSKKREIVEKMEQKGYSRGTA